MTDRPFISFMTDFGVGSSAPSVCRGVMLDITPDARLIDVTHAIRHFALALVEMDPFDEFLLRQTRDEQGGYLHDFPSTSLRKENRARSPSSAWILPLLFSVSGNAQKRPWEALGGTAWRR